MNRWARAEVEKAEEFLRQADAERDEERAARLVARAQVHATLAIAEAQIGSADEF